MRRILISQRTTDHWSFDWNDQFIVERSPLLAAWQAKQLGETLRGRALGYVIRLDPGWPGGELLTLHTELF